MHTNMHDGVSPSTLHPSYVKRRCLYAVLSIATALLGGVLMFDILRANGITPLEIVIWCLFLMSFSWLCVAFWSAAFGFFIQVFRLDSATLSARQPRQPVDTLRSRNAVIMPIYNEDTRRVFAGFEATLTSVVATGLASQIDFFIISDTTDPSIAATEKNAWQQLFARTTSLGVARFYRRREKNTQRKVGNIADFCTRWGAHYDHMIVIDADSIMTGACITQLIHRMENEPRTALIQTVPIPVRQTTFFGRFVQFAATLYSPMLATGAACWQGDAANYWGHNAIIRVSAFMAHCGLPSLDGKAPYGGDILSHDFVEAALLRRAGWDVILDAGIEGSYEEVPSNIIDYATRDRRWVQGNIQHLALLDTPALHPINRLHFFMGAFAYVSSLIWILLLVLSTIDAISRTLQEHVYFTELYQLYPDWPEAKPVQIISLILLTTCLLMGPKVLGVLNAYLHHPERFGGKTALLKSAGVEIVFAVLIAPIMMVYHTYFVMSVLLGFKVNWESQPREGRLISWREAIARTYNMSLVAGLWALLTFHYAPAFFWWLLPVAMGLVFSPLIVRCSSGTSWLGANTLFITPCETDMVPVLADVIALMSVEETPVLAVHEDAFVLPEEHPQPMPHLPLDQFHHRDCPALAP